MTTATLQTETKTESLGRWRMRRPDTHGPEHTPEGGRTHGAGQSTPGLLSARGVARRGPAGGPHSDAAQAADAARAAAQAERRRLARDLHDSVSQTLLALHWTAQAIVELWDTQPADARAALDTLCHLASGAATEMRAVILDLHDAVLEQQGLVAALDALGAVVRQRSGLQVELRVGPWERLPWAQEEALYSVAREALTNVVKHARARRATITLARDAQARLEVEDDGVGFGAPALVAFAYGLAGMRERMEALGGRLHLENRPGGGARVIAELPVPD